MIEVNENLVRQISELKQDVIIERERCRKLENEILDIKNSKEDNQKADSISTFENKNLMKEKKRSEDLSRELHEIRSKLVVIQRFEKKLESSSSMEQRLYERTKQLVEEGGKNVELVVELQKKKDKLKAFEEELQKFRIGLFQGINGGVLDVDNYSHVSIAELLRIRLQDKQEQIKEGSSHDIKDVDVIQRLEKKIHHLEKNNKILKKRYLNLEGDMENSGFGPKRIEDLNKKIKVMIDRSQNERDTRAKAENELRTSNKKIVALSDHIEKIMMHLKHEALSKVRALTEKTRIQKEVEMLKSKNLTLIKRNERKDRAIIEIKEGGKILEDQLRLMDEKYLELRMKLDWTRTQSERELRKKEDEARGLRSKFLVMENLSKGATIGQKVRIIKYANYHAFCLVWVDLTFAYFP